MGRIAVFDSGFGSLSIIRSIQKRTKSEIIYLADQNNYPYGKKTKDELKKIIKNTIKNLQKEFAPDLIVMGSNTPSLLFEKMFENDPRVVGVLPPLVEAQRLTKTNSIAMLVTNLIKQSTALDLFIKKNLVYNAKILKVNSSELVDLVESGKFIYDKSFCTKKIASSLHKTFTKNDVDVVTLSSTHLPFLLPFFKKIFPHVKFLDPAEKIANQIAHHKLFSPSKKNTLKIFSTGNVDAFQKKLYKIGIRKTVQRINF
jgi:glutamate racemase